MHRASIFLNLGRWEEASQAARYVHRLQPTEDFVLAFARFELGQQREALDAFLHAALNSPRAARMLVGRRTRRPTTYDEAEDHNTGVHFTKALHGYLSRRRLGSKTLFRRALDTPRGKELLDEAEEVVRRWHDQRGSDDREAFDRMNLMRSPAFARVEAAGIAKELGLE